MKVCYLIAPAICLLLSSCKKETATTVTGAPAENVGVSQFSSQICFEEHWDASGSLYQIPNIDLVYNNKVYFPQNANGSAPGDMTVEIYDGNTWQAKPSNVPIYTNYRNFTFTIGNKGYAGCLVSTNLFYEYDFASNTWTRKADFPGSAEQGITTFSVGSKGYVVGGATIDFSGAYSETWEYNPANNHWTRKANLPLGRYWSTGFSIGNKGYVVNGGNPLFYFHSLAQFDPVTDTWSFKSSFPGSERIRTQVFVIDGIAYAGGGWDYNGNVLKDFYKYSPSTDTWTTILDIPVPDNAYYLDNCFSINSVGYVGWENSQQEGKLKKYTPRICVPFPTTTAR